MTIWIFAFWIAVSLLALILIYGWFVTIKEFRKWRRK